MMRMDAEKTARRLLAEQGDALRRLETGATFRSVKQKLGDGEALRRAAETGDAAALSAAARTLLQSPEGAALAKELQKLLG